MLAFAAVSSLSLVTHQATRHGRPGSHPRNSGTPLTAITQRDPASSQPAPHSIQIVAFCETATVLRASIDNQTMSDGENDGAVALLS